MKQTPIPEKITNTALSSADEVSFKNINSLIDVVTEQQKEIEALKENNNYLLSKQSQAEQTIKIMNKTQPYTAMRSTGEKIADEQENREKQMKEDMRVVLDEFWMNGKEAGYLMKYDKVITTDTIIDRILAIVKGE